MLSIFLCYARADKRVVSSLAEKIRRAFPQYQAWYDEELTGGDRWRTAIDNRIVNSDIFIYCLSRESLESGHCQAEYKTAVDAKRRIIPVQVRPVSGVVPPEIKELQIIDISDDASDFTELFRAVAKQAPSEDAPGVFGPFSTRQTALVARKSALKAIDDWFRRYRACSESFFIVIQGEGGSGKTFIAEQFALKHRKGLGGNVYKLDAHSGKLSDNIRQLAQFPGFRQSEEVDARQLAQHIPRDSIIIIDNAPLDGTAPEDYRTLLEVPRGFCIVTTQSRAPSPFAHLGTDRNRILSLGDFSGEEAQSFLEHRLEEPIRRTLADHGHGVARFLDRFIHKSPYYLDRLCTIIERLYRTQQIQDAVELISQIERDISRVNEDAAERICHFAYSRAILCPSTERILLAYALFSSIDVPRQQLLEVADIGEGEAERAIATAIEWGLMQPISRKSYCMHELNHLFVRRMFDHASPAEQKSFRFRCVKAWLDFVSRTSSLPELWRMCKHIQKAVHIWSSDLDEPRALKLQDFDNALSRLQVLLPPKERAHFLSRLLEDETDLARIAKIEGALADGYLRAGKLVSAESCARQSIDHFDRLGDELNKAFILKRLGTIHRSSQEYGKSVDAFKQAMAIYARLSDDSHVVAEIHRQLGQTYIEIGSIAEARNSLIKATELLEALPCDKASTPQIRNSLAYALNTLGNVELKVGLPDNAYEHMKRALELHRSEVGPTHFYVAYDLRYLAKAAARRGSIQEAIDYLEESLRISRDFFGDSPNVALVLLTLAETQLLAHNTEAAAASASEALAIYKQEMGPGNKFVAYAYRILAEIALQNGDIPRAEENCEKAAALLGGKGAETPHMAEVDLLRARLVLHKGDVRRALGTFWQVRSAFIRFGMGDDVQRVDEYILSALLREGVAEWDESVDCYRAYLENFDQSLHIQLGRELVRRLEDEIEHAGRQVNVLDLLCGTGFVSRELAKGRWADRVAVTGVDGSLRMIAAARDSGRASDPGRFRFVHVPTECSTLATQQYQYVTAHMGMFQVDLRARHFLFRSLMPRLAPQCMVLLSTSAADFEFPRDPDPTLAEQLNKTNIFKPRLLQRFADTGYEPCALDRAVAPRFVKDDLRNIACFFEFYGFELQVPQAGQSLPFLRVERKWQDRVAFTRIPAISRKVFGKLVPEDRWNALGDVEDYCDSTFGVVLTAKRRQCLSRVPTVFSHVDVDFTKDIPVRYAIAAVIRGLDGRTLFLKRGTGARDFEGSWSLASTFADEGLGLLGSFYRSLYKNLGIQATDIGAMTPLSIRFSPRRDRDGTEWIMAMCLYEAELKATPHARSDKYESIQWENGPSFVNSLASQEMGDCTKSYRDLVRLGLAV